MGGGGDGGQESPDTADTVSEIAEAIAEAGERRRSGGRDLVDWIILVLCLLFFIGLGVGLITSGSGVLW